ncbi:hypothetical protein [uncultured Kordia sp.]|uniref:hypothetical protein n=1 Tax=uncultured Kordia sp. TaxID=507699 RepID=UPI002627A892|nr:hypothetical protein [uncultured Kordia sp.]
MKRIIRFFVIVTIFSSLSLLYAQEPLETSMDIAEVSYSAMPFPEVETMMNNGGALSANASAIKLPIESSTNFCGVIAAILCVFIAVIISFRIRRNTLKLF